MVVESFLCRSRRNSTCHFSWDAPWLAGSSRRGAAWARRWLSSPDRDGRIRAAGASTGGEKRKRVLARDLHGKTIPPII